MPNARPGNLSLTISEHISIPPGLYPARLPLEQPPGRGDGLSLMPWSRRFVDPIPTKGKPILTLHDAA
jgi:hypothetical protein